MGYWWILIAVIIIFVGFRLFTKIFGDWRASLNSIITSYIALKQLEPGYTDKQIFIAVLDGRYPKPEKDIGGIRQKMYVNKENVKQAIVEDIESGLSIFNRYNLPTLIFCCLVAEANTILNSKKHPTHEDLLEAITNEVIRQGFQKYV